MGANRLGIVAVAFWRLGSSMSLYSMLASFGLCLAFNVGVVAPGRLRRNRDLRRAFALRQMERAGLRRLEKETAVLLNSLSKATKIVESVMQQGGGALAAFRMSYDSLVLVEPLGEGAFGIVMRGRFKAKLVAVKTVRSTFVTKAMVSRFRSEAIVSERVGTRSAEWKFSVPMPCREHSAPPLTASLAFLSLLSCADDGFSEPP